MEKNYLEIIKERKLKVGPYGNRWFARSTLNGKFGYAPKHLMSFCDTLEQAIDNVIKKEGLFNQLEELAKIGPAGFEWLKNWFEYYYDIDILPRPFFNWFSKKSVIIGFLDIDIYFHVDLDKRDCLVFISPEQIKRVDMQKTLDIRELLAIINNCGGGVLKAP